MCVVEELPYIHYHTYLIVGLGNRPGEKTFEL